MKLPTFVTEEQFVSAFENVIHKLTSKFTFHVYDKDDIYQEAFIIAAEGVFNYNPNLGVPLESFLYTHLRNRLNNFRRNNYLRRETNCQECRKHNTTCQRCEQREKLNLTKKSILEPSSIENSNHPLSENKLDEQIDMQILLDKIIEKLPVDLVQDFYKIRDGVRINSNKKKRILELIREIAEEIDYAVG